MLRVSSRAWIMIRKIIPNLISIVLIGTTSSGMLAEMHSKQAAGVSAGDAPLTLGTKAKHLSANFNRHDVAKAMKLVADWQIGRLPTVAQTDWTFAALYPGLLALYNSVGDEKYRRAVFGISQELHWQPGPQVLNADDQAIGQTYLELYFIDHDPQMITAIRARMDATMATPDDPAKPLWWWCDALFMEPPVLADLSFATGDSKYLAYMDHEWMITSNLLYDREKHLYTRDATFLDKRENNGQKIFWARENGWVIAGLARVLDSIPAESPLRAKYALMLQQMASALAALQGTDGLWKPGLLDARQYPLSEVSGSAFITYALAYGINHGILDRKIYTPAVHAAWRGLLTHIYADGRLGSIQPIGAVPGDFTETSSYVYGVGAYLLAGSEIYRSLNH